MSPQPLETRADRLEKRVTALEQFPDRIDALTLEISQFRSEVRDEFSAVRREMQELAASLRSEMKTLGETLVTRMLVLHEDVISRIALISEGQTAQSARRKPRKK